MSNVALDRPPAGLDDPSLAKSDIFDVLSNERRRLVLRYLEHHDGAVDLGDLATQVAAWEYDVDPSAVSTTQRKRIYTTLQQTHLSKMDGVGIVDFDGERGVVSPTEHTQQLTLYLEVVPKNELAWREYYLLLGLAGCSLALGLWAGLPVFSAISTPVWLGLFGLLLAVSALVNRYHDQTMQVGDRSPPFVEVLERFR